MKKRAAPIFPIFFLVWSKTFAQTLPLESLRDFYPGERFSLAQEKNGPGELMEDLRSSKIHRFEVDFMRYKFPVFVQVEGDRILDFFAPLPSFLRHDPFHEALVARMGRQNVYVRKDHSAVYVWQRERARFYYGSACTLTCFTRYFSGVSRLERGPASFLERLSLFR